MGLRHTKPSVAIIGAGISGISLAHQLKAAFDVEIFERSHSAGGRFAHRHFSGRSFDHGAQFFRIFSSTFKSFLKPAIESKLIQEWTPEFAEISDTTILRTQRWDKSSGHLVATPHSHALFDYLSKPLTIHHQAEVSSVVHGAPGWMVNTNNGELGPFDWCVTATPPVNAMSLIPSKIIYRNDIQNYSMLPCYALMLALNELPDVPWQVALVKQSTLSWISINCSKPDRDDAPAMVCLASNQWAKEHFHLGIDDIQSQMLSAVNNMIPGINELIEASHCHRWSYANMPKQQGPQCFIDMKHRMASIGDWCIQGRVESGFLSAHALSQQMLSHV